MNSPIAQDSAAQSPGQVSDLSLFQRSGENMVKSRPEPPWLDRELEHLYHNDLCDVLRSPVQEGTLQEDVIQQARLELKHHDSAINKHLVKKATLGEKLKPWKLDSAVSSHIVDGDEGAVDPFQIEPAVGKRIRELEEASQRQDLAIQKHNSKKAALERGIKRHLDYEPGQPSKRPELGAAEEYSFECQLASLTELEAAPFAHPTHGSSVTIEACGHHEFDTAEFSDISEYGHWEESWESSPPSNQATFGDAHQEPSPQTGLQSTQPGNMLRRLRSKKQGAVAATGISVQIPLYQMFKTFGSLAISAWQGRKSRDKRAVPDDDFVQK